MKEVFYVVALTKRAPGKQGGLTQFKEEQAIKNAWRGAPVAQTISIGSTQHMDLFKAKLGRQLKLCEEDGLKIYLEESPAGKFTFLSCRIADCDKGRRVREDVQSLFKYYLADVISDIILNHWEDPLIKEIIRENYYYFGEEERNIIFQYALRHINREGKNFQDTVYWLGRKNRIIQKVMDYLDVNNRINIDGFIRFRLKDYIGELRDAADRAVDEFLMEREYREFIQLLKYFVEVQEPRMDVVHVLIAGSLFKLFDGRMQPVKSEYLEGFIVNMVGSEINYEDLLISALITIAPKQVTLHYKNREGHSVTLDTIKNVFEGRVNECRGCSLCQEPRS